MNHHRNLVLMTIFIFRLQFAEVLLFQCVLSVLVVIKSFDSRYGESIPSNHLQFLSPVKPYNITTRLSCGAQMADAL